MKLRRTNMNEWIYLRQTTHIHLNNKKDRKIYKYEKKTFTNVKHYVLNIHALNVSVFRKKKPIVSRHRCICARVQDEHWWLITLHAPAECCDAIGWWADMRWEERVKMADTSSSIKLKEVGSFLEWMQL